MANNKVLKRRVVVTGLGAITPIGNSVAEFWDGIRKGKVGIGEITKFDTTDYKVKLAAEVKDFVPGDHMDKKAARRMEAFSQYAVAAAREAYEDSGLEIEKEDPFRAGVMIGSGIGSLQVAEQSYEKILTKGPARVNPLMVPLMISNMAAGNVSIQLGFRGKCSNVVTACATGTNCIGDAFRTIQYGDADMMLAGGTEGCVCPLGIAGFTALTALSASTDPLRASIPFDKDRNGFVMGEGAGVLVIESLEHAQKRGANILAEIVGYGSNCDAYHMTTPTPDGSGAAKAIKLAINEAGIKPEDVDYVNAHGTSTPANEKGESAAIVSVLGKDVPVSSTKSFTGHLLGAAGAVEAIATIEAIRHSFVPKTAGTKELSDYIEANVVYGEGKEADIEYAISNTFGFGGHNAVLAFKRWEG